VLSAQSDPEKGSVTYKGDNPFTSFWSEAEFLPKHGGRAGGIFRVSLNNTSLRQTRKMAVSITLATMPKDGRSRRRINSYYASQLGCQLEPVGCSRIAAFVPYAVVRIWSACARWLSTALAHVVLRSCHHLRAAMYVQVELGCPALPYRPYLYFVNETGYAPAEGMAFDRENGVTVMALLQADATYNFTEPVQWAMVTDFEMQEKGATFSSLYEGLFKDGADKAQFQESWCFLKFGEFELKTGVSSAVHAHTCATHMHVYDGASHAVFQTSN
jgi:hypothetical protein